MPRGLVWGMNDHQGSWWVLIVVTHTHRLLAAKSGRSASRPHYHKAVLSPVALTFELRPWPVRAVVSATNYLGGGPQRDKGFVPL